MSARTKNQSYWSEQNRQWESSGLSQQKFCKEHNLSYRQFVHWRGLLNKSDIRKSEPKLLKISTRSAHPKKDTLIEPESCLEVILPTGIKLQIKTEADISKASTLIQLLGGVR